MSPSLRSPPSPPWLSRPPRWCCSATGWIRSTSVGSFAACWAGPSVRTFQQQFWYRWTRFVIRRAVPVGLAGVAFLVFLGLPFLSVKWGFPDDRVLPTSASAHQVGDQMRDDFVINSETAVSIVIPDTDDLAKQRD